jgi:hypothetical protein
MQPQPQQLEVGLLLGLPVPVPVPVVVVLGGQVVVVLLGMLLPRLEMGTAGAAEGQVVGVQQWWWWIQPPTRPLQPQPHILPAPVGEGEEEGGVGCTRSITRLCLQ